MPGDGGRVISDAWATGRKPDCELNQSGLPRLRAYSARYLQPTADVMSGTTGAIPGHVNRRVADQLPCEMIAFTGTYEQVVGYDGEDRGKPSRRSK